MNAISDPSPEPTYQDTPERAWFKFTVRFLLVLGPITAALHFTGTTG